MSPWQECRGGLWMIILNGVDRLWRSWRVLEPAWCADAVPTLVGYIDGCVHPGIRWPIEPSRPG